MGRLLLVLSAACLVFTFVMLWKIPFDPGRIFSSPRSGAENTQPTKVTDSKKKPDTPQATRGRKKAKAGPSRASSVAESKSNVRDVEPAPSLEGGQEPSQASVKSDSAAVYTVNTSESEILRLLRKGDSVKTDLEVIDREGRWSLIKGAKEKRSGYVRSDNLETKQPSKRKN